MKKMRKIFLIVMTILTILVLNGFTVAQQWNGVQNTTGEIFRTGKVGIGTTSLASNLHLFVPSSSAPISAMTIDVNTFGTPENARNSYFFRVRDIGANNFTPFYIRGDGHVGIGTTEPKTALQVEDVFLTGNELWLQNNGGSIIFGPYDGSNIQTATAALATGWQGGTNPSIEMRVTRDDRNTSIRASYDGNIVLNGNVGIRTASPASNLHLSVPGSSTSIGAMTIDVNTFGTPENAKNSYFFRVRDIGANNFTPFYIRGDGHVGIGTAEPKAHLHVTGGTLLSGLAVGADSDEIDYQWEYETVGVNSKNFNLRLQSPNHIVFHAGQDQPARMSIAPNGNVGIGIVGPNANLHLNVPGSSAPISAMTIDVNTFGTPENARNSHFFQVRDIGANNFTPFYIRGDGHVGIGTIQPETTLDVNGTTTTSVLTITGGADLSEHFEVNGALDIKYQPGMVVSIDTQNPGKLIISKEAYDRKVAGIISGAGGIETGLLMGQANSIADGATPVALSGRVYCWADASYGSIEPGDLLTTANTIGHAMKVSDYNKAQGAIIGKAMTSLNEGKGLVLVLVSLQ